MLTTFSRWEKSCSTMGTRVRSPRAGHTSSCLVAAGLASSSEAHELLRDLGALAVIRAHTLPPQLHSMGPRRKSFRPVYVESLLDTSTWRPTDASGSTGNRHLPLNLCPQPPWRPPSHIHPGCDGAPLDLYNWSSTGDPDVLTLPPSLSFNGSLPTQPTATILFRLSWSCLKYGFP